MKAMGKPHLAPTLIPSIAEQNPLGRRLGSWAALIDAILCGATKEQMAVARGAVDEHLLHLREDNGLTLVENNGVWSFDRSGLSAGKSILQSFCRQSEGLRDGMQIEADAAQAFEYVWKG
jgi:hypothetical protein